MALSSHLEAVLNGMFLVLLGLLWPHIDLPGAWKVAVVVLVVYAAYANWLATLLAAAWGAGRKLAPIAAGGHEASAAKEDSSTFSCCPWRRPSWSGWSSSSSGSDGELNRAAVLEAGP